MSGNHFNDIKEYREAVRSGKYKGHTNGQCPRYLQANLTAIPQKYAADFTAFCALNPKAFPLVDITEPGCPIPRRVAPSGDLRTDLPFYEVYIDGQLIDRPSDVKNYWTEDMVGFLFGCSFTFENALIQVGIPNRHVEEGLSSTQFLTDVDLKPVGQFEGKLQVTMRPMKLCHVSKAIGVTSGYYFAHGSPVHVGDPTKLGIRDLNKPDALSPISLNPDEVPVFTACGGSIDNVLRKAKLPIAITHGIDDGLFVCDVLSDDYDPLSVQAAKRAFLNSGEV